MINCVFHRYVTLWCRHFVKTVTAPLIQLLDDLALGQYGTSVMMLEITVCVIEQ